MQHRIFQRAIVALGALALLGCDVHDNGPATKRNVNAVLPLDAAAASNHTTEILNGLTFTGIPGSVLAQNTVPASTGLNGQTVSLKFSGIAGANGNFTLTGSGVTASGTVHFASCTFTITTSSNATTLPVGTVITISACSVTVTATGVPVGDPDGTLGTITLSLNGVVSAPVTITVILDSEGRLIIRNGDGVEITTIFVISGSSGS